MPDSALMTFVKVHDWVYRRTNGLIGHRMPGVPSSLMLHTIGAKTGQPRSNLLAYYRDGEDYLIVASNGGADRNPAWYHNLRAQPKIEINLGRKRLAVTAHIVMPDDPDYARLWHICDSNNGGRYSSYQRGTRRPIPVVRLTP
ncbi:nitroreductase family deazaflavin-dependent oxidoreductase [Mycolicibacterium aichiense]|uniref:F420H(2)-dependent quinone reductase n=1 Tax=Mycolicibacterium aichiense TaxID=1799 RepID=A0AAD1HQ12_9MYCO|nr:nitroreductase family deazaflavin-dependent oxidoreductase [Mycolicibacterium aichiense]MCV7019337.1 nitroreductase family deazaflavin-dependent oxidoreductase [Mycolicibacterium aichiense]BBX09250.1 F420H(2)-dependent quinone reductase [Mycolicibacterium aichiense]SUA13820.1 deazaflavin-dependent nitroreductase family protein [Mycolicibacterium aichiense]